MLLELTGVVLAGGGSTRMGLPKPLLMVGGERLIDRQLRLLGEVFGRLMVVGASIEGLGVDVPAVPDDERFAGLSCPLNGIHTALAEAGSDVFVVACDMPFIEPSLMGALCSLPGGHDLVIPRVGGLAEPLFGLYRKSAGDALAGALERGERSVQAVFGELAVRYVDEAELMLFDPGLRSFVNVNTPSDLATAERLADGLAAGCGAPPLR